MTKDCRDSLDRWTAAGLLTADAAASIRAWENARSRSQGLSWPIRIALAFGVILLAAGVLLFFTAHWDQLSRTGRMSLLVATVALLHGAGAAVARRFEALAVALHVVGSVSLGGALTLAVAVFDLSVSEHWPAVLLLWAIGCALAWLILGHWTQAALSAILFPWWLAAQWAAWIPRPGAMLPAWTGICALSLIYLGARRSAADAPLRKALAWIGGLALLPASGWVACYGPTHRINQPLIRATFAETWLAWTCAVLLSLAVALLLDRRRIIWRAAAIAWTLVLAIIGGGAHERLAIYAWCFVGAAGLALWGIREARPERINLGIAGLALTVLMFYSSDVMDKLSRSASLIGFGLLFLGGGWLLERTRRRLMAHMSTGAL